MISKNIKNKNIVLCSYFNYKKDSQRNVYWENDHKKLIPLIESVTKKEREIYVFYNNFDKPVPNIPLCHWIKVDPNFDYDTSTLRFLVYRDFLSNLAEKPNSFFMVDSTDVIMLNDPFDHLNDEKLYIGDEIFSKINCPWLMGQGKLLKLEDFSSLINSNKKRNLLNCGLIGGKFEKCMEFLIKYCDLFESKTKKIHQATDMAALNYIILKYFFNDVIHGLPVNTIFTKDEKISNAWWKHK